MLNLVTSLVFLHQMTAYLHTDTRPVYVTRVFVWRMRRGHITCPMTNCYEQDNCDHSWAQLTINVCISVPGMTFI